LKCNEALAEFAQKAKAGPNSLSLNQSAGGAWRSGPVLLDVREVNHEREEIQTGLQVRALRKRGRNDDHLHPGGSARIKRVGALLHL